MIVESARGARHKSLVKDPTVCGNHGTGQETGMNGLVIIDKPAGRTSHDIVNAWRRLSGSRRVGHLGTLDPMATGVLALVVGSATRLAQFYGKQLKTYEAEILFGRVSDTYDVEGEVTPTGVTPPDPFAVRTALDHFRGSFRKCPRPSPQRKSKAFRPISWRARRSMWNCSPFRWKSASLSLTPNNRIP